MPAISNVMPDFSLMQLDSGRYQLLAPLGSGAFGVVYRARERIPHAPHFVSRAIKLVPRAHPNSSRGYRQQREATLHRMVSGHPNVISLLRVIRDEHFIYYVMDYCPGGDLFRAIRKKHAFARNDALVKQVFLQILDGVESLHAKGVFHRDLKPENILVSEDCTRAWIGDFGLATQQKQSTAFNTGSRYFMSPECIDCDDVLYPYNTWRSDMWALGMILLNLVTGRHPWHKALLKDPDFRAYFENPEQLRTIFPISTGLNDLLHRVLTMVPDDCISLDEFRKGIRDMDTFWMSEQEIEASGEIVQYVWNSYQPAKDVQLLRQIQASTADSDESEGDVLASETSSESSNSLTDDSDDSDERVEQGVPTRALAEAEEGRFREPETPAPPNSPEHPSDPETETKTAVASTPLSRTLSSAEFPIRGRGHVRRKPAPHYSATDDSEWPVTPPMRPQELPEVAIAAPLEDEVLQVERAAVARVTEPEKKGPSLQAKVTNFLRGLVPGRL
ncbi:kinase-like protein [Lentinus brumalis]|uniref:Kinase-like protein n=1 Tax=Lentinus brumalis TaxID=2498619 RepID=A0A371DPY9_9APHY|nr:kinase-like protein [Polyporus brumalis]